MKLDLKELIKKMIFAGLVPDYAHTVGVSSLPYTAPSHGIVMYAVGDGANAGSRDLLVNGVQVGLAKSSNGEISTITAFVAKGDIISGAYGIWGTMRFIPYKLGGVVRKLLKSLKPLTLGRGWAV